MPELPEVEVVRAGLEPALVGAVITGVELFDRRSLKRHESRFGEFESLTQGAEPLAVVRRGKFLWIPFSGQRAMVAHLGMSGQMLLRDVGEGPGRQTRVRFTLSHHRHGEFAWHFDDQRIFGSLAIDELVPTKDGFSGGYAGTSTIAGGWEHRIPARVAHIARDPLDPHFDQGAVVARIRRSQSGIKRVLLDQTVLSGVGNIYADEALWLAQVHYDTVAATLRPSEANLLMGAVRDVLEKALSQGGTSFDAQYVNVNGASGYFSHSLNAYGRQGQPCARCGAIVRREPFMNRGSHFCPRCQRRRTRAARVKTPRVIR